MQCLEAPLALPCRRNFPAGSRLVLAGTIQFASCIQAARQQLADEYVITVPQVMRRSALCSRRPCGLLPGAGCASIVQAARVLRLCCRPATCLRAE